MTTIYNTTTGEIAELSCIIDGVDILDDVMGNYGVDTVQPFDDTEWLFALPGEEIEWWAAWAEREERIQSALEETDEATRAACYEACDSDLEASQDRVAHILGIEPQDLQACISGIDQSNGDRPSLSSEAKTAKEAALALGRDTGTEAEREQAIE